MDYKHLSGRDFNVMIGNFLVHVENINLTITDNKQAVQTDGIPSGYVSGDISAKGDLEVDLKNFKLINQSAQAAGSWEDLPTFDIIVMGSNTSSEEKIEAFGCLFKISDLLGVDKKGGEKSKRKIEFEVTSPDFIKIDGVPYLSAQSSSAGF
jgi:hypothetical protein